MGFVSSFLDVQRLGEVPDNWKNANTIAIFKMNQEDNPENYTAFGLTPCERHGTSPVGAYMLKPAWLYRG